MNALKNILRSKWVLVSALVITALLLSWQAASLTSSGCHAKLFLVGSSVCHQIPSHSFITDGLQFPVCARCTGLYLGAFIGLIAGFSYGRRKGIPNRYLIGLLATLFLLWSGDGLNSFISDFLGRPFLYSTTNMTRLITGYGMGLVMAAALVTLFNNTAWDSAYERPVLESGWQVLAYAGLSALSSLLVLLPVKLLLQIGSVIAVATILVIISLLYAIFWMIILKKENSFSKISDLTVIFLLGFCTAMLQILFFVNLRSFIF